MAAGWTPQPAIWGNWAQALDNRQCKTEVLKRKKIHEVRPMIVPAPWLYIISWGQHRKLESRQTQWLLWAEAESRVQRMWWNLKGKSPKRVTPEDVGFPVGLWLRGALTTTRSIPWCFTSLRVHHLTNIFFNFIYLFIYGCVGSSFLCEGFL